MNNIINEKQKEIIKDYDFSISEYNDIIEIETYTNYGVDMIIDIDKGSDQTLVQQLENYLDNFDIDYEIDLYRENEDYKRSFTISESLEDFNNWIDRLDRMIQDLKKEEDNYE